MLPLSALLLSRAYAFLALWSLVKFLQAASFDSKTCADAETAMKVRLQEKEEEEGGEGDSPRLSSVSR